MGRIAGYKALVIFSGGQDSTTCLYWAIDKFGKENVETVTFDYGQKHHMEIEAAEKICSLAGVDFDLVQIPNVLRSSSSLLAQQKQPQINRHQIEQHDDISQFSKGIQSTFVPGRNILFLTIAANIALSKNCNHLVTGVCQEDFGGYYDCRDDFVQAMERALNQGLFGVDQGFQIHTPLMSLNKRQIVELAVELSKNHGNTPNSCLNALAFTHTCYEGVFPPCGKCHACHLRARGFREAGIEDPLLARIEDAIKYYNSLGRGP